MANERSVERILEKLDEYLHKNNYASAEEHLLFWQKEAVANRDLRIELLVQNELMGLYRKLGKEKEALDAVSTALQRIEEQGISHQVGAATTYLNAATVYKAFGRAEEAIPLFEKAKAVYESGLEKTDTRLAGLYNNMGLALVDVGRYSDADELYKKALLILEQNENGAPEAAITYLNMASAAEAELGALEADEKIQGYLVIAKSLLEDYPKRDGYYAFVCEKCASVFGYYGHFFYEKELKERARRIYGR